jgi:hypothetical protein
MGLSSEQRPRSGRVHATSGDPTGLCSLRSPPRCALKRPRLYGVNSPEDGGTICTQKVGEAERELTTAEGGRKASKRVLTQVLSGSSAVCRAADPTNLRAHELKLGDRDRHCVHAYAAAA